jgi:hypothetical protein
MIRGTDDQPGTRLHVRVQLGQSGHDQAHPPFDEEQKADQHMTIFGDDLKRSWDQHPELLMQEWTMTREPEQFGMRYKFSMDVMSVGEEGLEWLETNAPGWRDHVGLVHFAVERIVADSDYEWVGPIIVVNMARGEMIKAMATHLVDKMEPMVEEVE